MYAVSQDRAFLIQSMQLPAQNTARRIALLVVFSAQLVANCGCNSFGNSRLVKELQSENDRLLAEFRAQRDRSEELEKANRLQAERLAESEKLLARLSQSTGAGRLSSLQANFGQSTLNDSQTGGGLKANATPSPSSGLSGAGTNSSAASELRWQPRIGADR